MSGLENFLRNLDTADKRARSAVDKGLGRAGAALMRDAIMEEPAVPLDEGTLRASGSVHVQGQPLMTSGALAGGAAGNPNTGTLEIGTGDAVRVAHVGFNTPYAAKMHEGVDLNFQHSGTGAKFLEAKMAANKQDYMGIVADTVKKALGGQS